MFNSCYGTGGNFMHPSLSVVQDKASPCNFFSLYGYNLLLFVFLNLPFLSNQRYALY